MHIDDVGSGSAVLILHGTPGSRAHFAPLIDALAPSHRVLFPEMPGYARSPALEGSYTIGRVETMIEDALLARGVREVAIVGHSIGAFRALSLARSARVRVTHVASLGGFHALDNQLRETLASRAAAAHEGVDFHPLIVDLMTAPGFAARHPEHARELISWLDLAPMSVMVQELEAVLAVGAVDVSSIRAPILALTGDKDESIPPRYSHFLADAAPNARTEIIEAVGHALLYEAPDRTISAVRALLRQ